MKRKDCAKSLADKLDKLQKVKNYGRGVSAIRTVIVYLRSGRMDLAKAVCRNKADEFYDYADIEGYYCADIKDLLIKELFKGGGNPWFPIKKANISYKKRRRLSGPALRAFFKIAKFWKLNVGEEMRLLGIKSYQALGRRRKGKIVLSKIELEMLSWIVGIYKSLHILLPDGQSADSWMKKKPNDTSVFEGKSAMEYIMESNMHLERIIEVENYLKAKLV